jgi:PPM family protein phosphatase
MVSGFRYASRAMVGAREGQEDSCRFLTVVPAEDFTTGASNAETLLAVLADGMGGHVGGAEASTIACDAFVTAYQDVTGDERSRLQISLDTSNRALLEALRQDGALRGMGCTLVGALFNADGILWVSVGDSPLLLFRDDKIVQLNEDHSLAPMLEKLVANGEMTAAEAEHHPRRHYLRAALTGDNIELVDLSSTALALRPGDVVLLASDGLDVLSHAEIAELLAARPGEGPEAIADTLLAAVSAKALPNQDNVTLMVVQPLFAD